MVFHANLERLRRTADRPKPARPSMLRLPRAKGRFFCQGGDVCLNLPTKPVSLPPPQVCLYQGRTHREYSHMCYPPILSITEWQEAKLVGCSWRSCLLIRCFRQGSDHCGYSSPPPTATECGKDNPASPLPPPFSLLSPPSSSLFLPPLSFPPPPSPYSSSPSLCGAEDGIQDFHMLCKQFSPALHPAVYWFPYRKQYRIWGTKHNTYRPVSRMGSQTFPPSFAFLTS